MVNAMSKINIPPAALEAGALATLEELDAIAGLIGATRVDGELSPEQQEFFRRIARAAFVAMVEAWPGMKTETIFWSNADGHGCGRHTLFLPIMEACDE